MWLALAQQLSITTGLLASVTAGLLAGAFSWLINCRIVTSTLNWPTLYLIPLVEEASKTLIALAFHTSVPISHLVFGMVELVYDSWVNGKRGLWAGLSGLLAHGIFGLITTSAAMLANSWIIALLAGYLAHLSWNWVILRWLPSLTNRHHRKCQ